MIFGENDSQPQGLPPGGQPQQRSIRLDTSGMDTVYSNFFALAGTAEEITLYLGASSPMPGMNEPMLKISHRTVLLPSNAKRLMLALQQTIKAHEDRFGPIEIAPMQPPKGGQPG